MFTAQEMREMGYKEDEIADIERKNAEVIKKRSAELPTTKEGLEALFESMPLTATKMPEEENELFEAMKALQKEIPAEERAEALKESGNEAFKLAKKEGAKRYKDAEVYYTQALEVDCKDSKLNSQIYSNRALVYLTTGSTSVSVVCSVAAWEVTCFCLQPTMGGALRTATRRSRCRHRT